jgi:hypothetical protein
MNKFLQAGERVDETISGDGFKIHVLSGNQVKKGDEVFVEVDMMTPDNVLSGGSEIKAQVLQGFGWLTTKNMRTNETSDFFLEQGSGFTISPDDTYYRVTNLSGDEGPLVYRDTCEDFDIKNEPTLEVWLAAQQQ